MESSTRCVLWIVTLLLSVSISSAYTINEPISVQVKVQLDDGVFLTDILAQACIGSVYAYPLYQFVVRDQPLINGSLHYFSFTPTLLGEYGISVKCDYNNESATYFEKILVEPKGVSVSSGSPAVVNLNAEVVPDAESFLVDVASDPRLKFDIKYLINSLPADSYQFSFTILKDDAIIQRGQLKYLSRGNYQFDYNVSSLVVGDYKILLAFDGRSKLVDLKVVELPKRLGFITGWIVDDAGQVNKLHASIAILLFLILLLLLFVLVRRIVRRKPKKQKLYK